MKRNPTRIILGYRGKNYKFMSFFVDGRDNSFYFHIYRKPGEYPMKLKSPQSEESTSPHIHFPDFEPTGFEENKFTFHQSGYINSKDSKGNRYRDDVRGIPFSEIESNLSILAVAPENPSNMLELLELDSKRDVHIALSDNEQPFVVHFIVHKKDSPIMPEPPPDDLLHGRFIQRRFDDKEFDLLIGMSKVDKAPSVEKVEWPPFHVVLKRIG